MERHTVTFTKSHYSSGQIDEKCVIPNEAFIAAKHAIKASTSLTWQESTYLARLVVKAAAEWIKVAAYEVGHDDGWTAGRIAASKEIATAMKEARNA